MTREEAIKDIEENILPIVGGISLRMAIEALQERKTGKWIDGHCMCSICKWYQTNRFGFAVSVNHNYCPNCGAKMEVEE